MRRYVIVILAVVLLAGCSSGGGHPAPSDWPMSVRVSAYVHVMRRQYPTVAPSLLVRAGRSVCGAWRAGSSWPQQIEVAMRAGMTARRAGYAVGASTRTFCPQYLGKVPGG